MTNDEILQAAKEAGFHFYDAGHAPILHTVASEYSQMCFERFAAIIERQTIERCAVVAEELRHPDGYSGENVDWCAGTDHAAAAIRKLGEQ